MSRRRFFFSLKVTLICAILSVLMLRASYWQWERYLYKLELVATLKDKITSEVIPYRNFLEVFSERRSDYKNYYFKRAELEGQFDFSHEFVLRNRKLGDIAGVHIITPFRLKDQPQAVLIDRGFIPWSSAKGEQRKRYHTPAALITISGLIREGRERKSLLAVADETPGGNSPWVDAWLRIDISEIQKQIPYPILPIYLEELDEEVASSDLAAHIVNEKSGRDELLFLPGRSEDIQVRSVDPDFSAPKPDHEKIFPPSQHLGYVYEWAFMALLTIGIGIILQLRPPRIAS